MVTLLVRIFFFFNDGQTNKETDKKKFKLVNIINENIFDLLYARVPVLHPKQTGVHVRQ